ncbi:MAG: hypothetical protein M3Y55_13085, partial [Pseudomonadota bacterium]|nr:hypothetical protein [Pseudomonadota bacterium]
HVSTFATLRFERGPRLCAASSTLAPATAEGTHWVDKPAIRRKKKRSKPEQITVDGDVEACHADVFFGLSMSPSIPRSPWTGFFERL